MPSEISVPFRVDGNGKVITTSNPDAQVRLHVLALLNTIPEERAMVPGYGVNTVGLMFENPGGDEIATQVATLVRDGFRVWEPGVDLIRAVPDISASDDDFSKVEVEYRRLDAADSGTVANSNTAIIGANGKVREIVRG